MNLDSQSTILGRLIFLLCLVALAPTSFASNSEESVQDARAIMDQVDSQQRKLANGALTLARLSSCPFSIEGKKVRCSEESRVKVLESVSVQLGDDLKDSQSVAIILEPAREKGIGMLTYSYDDDQKDTESWLYLSALGKVKRMVSGSSVDQEPVAFFGSEFTTEDMENGKTDEYQYKILQEGKYGSGNVWVIEARPKPVRLRKTKYSKLLLWIDKAKLVPLKIQGYDKYDKLYKRTIFKAYRKINELWTAQEVTVFNLRDKRLSTMSTQEIALGVKVDSEFLSQRSLTDFAFRERTLSKLRQNFQ